MKRFLTVTTAASDHALLTIGEMRTLAGATDGSQDVALTALGLRIAAAITAECNVAIGVGANPTLLQETLTETFFYVDGEILNLSRRFDVTITSVVEDDITLDTDEYLVEPESGFLNRLDTDGYPCRWCAQKVVVVYQAGFATVPSDLKQAAMDTYRATYLEETRDPLVKRLREDIPGVREIETDYWVGTMPGQSEGPIPAQVMGQLKRFRNGWVG
jgi:hypothetical protein